MQKHSFQWVVLVISANMCIQLTDAYRRPLSELVTQWEAH